MSPSVSTRVASSPPFRRSQPAIFTIALCTLAALALWQQFQIRELTRATGNARERHPFNVRHLQGSRVAMNPSGPHRQPGSPRNGVDAGPDGPTGSWRPMASTGEAATVFSDHEFMSAYELYREGMLDLRYADLFRRLSLGPEALAAFKRLLAQKDSLALDVVAVTQSMQDAAGGGPLPPAVRSAEAEIEQSIRSTLGDDRYDAYRDYEATMAQRATVSQLERRLSYSPAPLAPGQADALVKVLATNAPRDSGSTVPSISFVVGNDPSGVMPVVNPDASGLITDEAISEARQLLTPLQISALQALQIEQRAALNAGRLITEGSSVDLFPPQEWGLLLQ
ncbi:MAG TPA: hypothetical protein VGM73_02275 [Candidatus Didemnitutus sp.]|jgi:hypothetical protein